MTNEKIYETLGFVWASEYRINVIKCIGEDMKIPSAIGNEIGLRTNHVSNVLKDLKENGIVICLNEKAKKGRIYKNTELGLEILKLL